MRLVTGEGSKLVAVLRAVGLALYVVLLLFGAFLTVLLFLR